MTERGDEQAIGILRIDGDLRNLLRIAEAQVRPRRAGVGRLVDAVADREVRARQPFAAADVEDVGIRRRNRHPANRSGRLVVEDRLPGAAGVVGLPDAAVHHAYIEGEGLTPMSRRRLRPPRAKRPDVAPLHFSEERG